MTELEFKQEFLIAYDKVTSLSAPGYDDLEISVFLTEGQERLVKRHYNYKGNKYGEGFEGTEKRRKDLSELVRDSEDNSGNLTTQISSNQNGTLPNGVFFDLPSDFLYTIKEEVVTDLVDCTVVPNIPNKRIGVKAITHDEYTANIRNPFKKPTQNIAWRLDFSRETVSSAKRHELITDGTYNITEYPIRYIRRPQPIIVGDLTVLNGSIEGVTTPQTSELDESMHREIINEAVAIALERVQEPRLQTQVAQTQLTE